MAQTAIQAVGLSKWFGEEAQRTWAVREVSFDAAFAEMLYIVGPSGSGKTTLLSMLSGILRPNQGRVEVEGTDVWSLDDNRLADFRLNTVGFVFQDYHLFPRLSSVENVAIPLILRRREWHESMLEAEHYLEIVGLKERALLTPTKLSGGEQQRVAIARAIAGRPDVLIFDEPTASLDGETGRNIIQLVRRELLNDKRCILIVTHDDRIYDFADRILKMEDGRVVAITRGAAGH